MQRLFEIFIMFLSIIFLIIEIFYLNVPPQATADFWNL